MLKKILLIIMMVSSFIAFSQSYNNQGEAKNDLKKYIKYFGASGTKTISGNLYKDPQTGIIFFRTTFTKNRTTVKGKTYYNMMFKVELILKNVNYVSERGNKLYFDLNSNGYHMNIKAPRENWIGNQLYTNDFFITINNSSIRKKALKAFKYLVKNPIYYK